MLVGLPRILRVPGGARQGLLRILVQAKDVMRDLARRLARHLPGVRPPSDKPCRIHFTVRP